MKRTLGGSSHFIKISTVRLSGYTPNGRDVQKDCENVTSCSYRLDEVTLNRSIFQSSTTCRWGQAETFVNCVILDAWILISELFYIYKKNLTRQHLSASCPSWTHVADLYSGYLAVTHGTVMRPSGAEVISFVLYSQRITLQWWHTRPTCGSPPCMGVSGIPQNGSAVHIAPLLWINRSWGWIMHGVITHGAFCVFQGCVQIRGLYDHTCRTRLWLWGLQEDVHR